MNYTPKKIRRILKKQIKIMSEHPELYAKNPGKDFTRKRKLPFQKTISTILSLTGKSLSNELLDIFELNLSMPTVSAFIQQRNKIDYRAFEALFHSFTHAVNEQKLFKGYRLLAVDGTKLHTPTNPDEINSFYEGTNGQKPYNLIHLNALYDLNRRIYVDAIIQDGRKGNEYKAFVDMVDRDNSHIPTIYIADRGFEAYNNMAHVIEKGQNFLIRIKDIGSNGIASRLSLPEEDEFDASFSLAFTRKQTNSVKNSDLEYLPHNVVFDFLPDSTKKGDELISYSLSFRLVRFKLTDDTYELLITNLDRNVFSVNDLKELYAMRWGIETSFRELKYTLALNYFHSKKTEYILQEVFARLVMYNFYELITSHVVVKQNNRKYLYQINFSNAVHICRKFFLKNIGPSKVEALLLMHLLPIRQGPTSPRRKSPKQSTSFTYRIP